MDGSERAIPGWIAAPRVLLAIALNPSESFTRKNWFKAQSPIGRN
ncbi:hypothetical protein [Microcoleus sp. N9_A1]